MGSRLTEDFLNLFCEKNSNGTRNLRLKGRDLQCRIGTRLIADDMKTIADFLVEHESIIKLDVCYNDIGDEGIQIFADEYLSKPNGMETLNLIGCDLTHVAIKALYSVRNTLNLKTLRLASNRLGAEAGRFLAQLIDFSPTLNYLDIGDTNQTVFSVNGILSRATFSSLTVLDLSRILPENCYRDIDTAELCMSLSSVLAFSKQLVELHVQKCDLDGHDVDLLFDGLSRNQALLLLDLAYNKIGDYGMEIIGKWLVSRPNLLGLNVAGNRIGDMGGRTLGLTMPYSKLRFVDISYNNIEDLGMIAILKTLKKPFLLRIFYFWGNKFGPKTNEILHRLLWAKVLQQENIDVKLYEVGNLYYAAYYPANHYKHRYYSVMDHGCGVELKIVKNYIPPQDAKPRALVNFVHMDRYPPVERRVKIREPSKIEYYPVSVQDVAVGPDAEQEIHEDAYSFPEKELYTVDELQLNPE